MIESVVETKATTILEFFRGLNGSLLGAFEEAPAPLEINPVFGSDPGALPSFLHPLMAVGARRIEFSLDFEF